MKKIEAIVDPVKLDEIKQALEKEKIAQVGVFEIRGVGSQQGRVKHYRGAEYVEDSTEVKVEIIVEDDEADRITQTLVTSLRAGDLCDGEITVLPVDKLIRVRVGKCA
jgi:nitrogen regulatory protein P-II 1